MSLILRVLAAGTALGLIGLTVAASLLPRTELDGPQLTPSRRLVASALPPSDPSKATSLMDRSPFTPSRSAFSRNAPSEAPPAPIEVKLSGVYKIGKEMRANLVIAGQSLVVKKGDDTPIGKVSKIESNAVTIEGDPPRRVEMFKQ
jgi:hypothetical protein